MTDPDISVMVTGSGGFLGRRLTARLRRAGWDVVEWKDDVRNIAECDRQVDVVLHLAAMVRHDRFVAEVHAGYDVNVTGTLAVLNYCHKVGARCVLASTSGVYLPSPGGRPITEEMPTGPNLPYNISKWLAENLCRRQAEDLGVPSVALRLFNVYGPGQHPSFLVPEVVHCLMSGTRIYLRMPEALRDFVYVDDVVKAFMAAARLPESGHRVFNIGSGSGTRVIDLVHLAEGHYGRAVGIEVAGPHVGEPSAVVADVRKAREELGWGPTFCLTDGLGVMKSSLEAATASG